MGSMAIATLSYNLDSPQPAHITLCGTKQSLRATFAPGHSLERLPVGLDDPRSVLFDVGLELGSGFAGVARRWDFLTSVAVKGWRSGHYRQIRAFVNSMLGFGEPTVSVREILQFMQVYSEILRRLPVAAKQVVSPQPEALDTPVRRSPDQK
jgi:predicted dehydrogenase